MIELAKVIPELEAELAAHGDIVAAVPARGRTVGADLIFADDYVMRIRSRGFRQPGAAAWAETLVTGKVAITVSLAELAGGTPKKRRRKASGN